MEEVMKEQLYLLFKVKGEIDELKEKRNEIESQLLTKEFKERALKFTNRYNKTESTIIKELEMYPTCYDCLVQVVKTNWIEFSHFNGEDFTVLIQEYDRDNELFSFHFTMPIDPDRDEEYIKAYENTIIKHWQKEAEERKEEAYKTKKARLERLKKEVAEAENEMEG
jgi:hypothetical protein